jgi:hypothetical protein
MRCGLGFLLSLHPVRGLEGVVWVGQGLGKVLFQYPFRWVVGKERGVEELDVRLLGLNFEGPYLNSLGGGPPGFLSLCSLPARLVLTPRCPPPCPNPSNTPCRVHAYYALILRSLTVLEGLALSADPRYKLLGRAYPYMARRLLTDPAPELRESFEELIIKVGVLGKGCGVQGFPQGFGECV